MNPNTCIIICLSPPVTAVLAASIRGAHIVCDFIFERTTSSVHDVAALVLGLLLVSACTLAASGSVNNEEQVSSVRVSSARVVGTVFCDTCFEQQFSKSSYFISGATVAVECRIKKHGPSFRVEAESNEYGEFKVELPSSTFHSEKQVKRCSVRLLRNSESSCKVASIVKSSSLTLKSKQGGIHTYSAGSFTYRPQSPPALCSKDATSSSKTKTSSPNSDTKPSSAYAHSQVSDLPPFLTPLPSPPSPPPLSPPPLLPPLPTIPQLPPVTLPPIPFLTPSPPPPLFHLPPIPFLTPPPASILPPGLPLPPNPFQPPPLIPRLPPSPPNP